jgi:hypothetical protein
MEALPAYTWCPRNRGNLKDGGHEGVDSAGADGLSAHGPGNVILNPGNVYNLPLPVTVGMRGSVRPTPVSWTL